MPKLLLAARVVCCAMLAASIPNTLSGEEITDALQALLKHRVDLEKREVGIVVGLVFQNGSRVVSYGNLDNGTDQKIDGDNCSNSRESRTIGFVALGDVLGDVHYRHWPAATWRRFGALAD